MLSYAGSNYVLHRLSDALDLINGLISMEAGNLAYSSNSIRLYGIRYTLGIFCDRPILGVGIGNVFCDSGVVSLIASVGILGTMAWFIYLLSWVGIEWKLKLQLIVACFTLYVLPNLFANSIECMFLIIIPFLMQAYKKNILEVRL